MNSAQIRVAIDEAKAAQASAAEQREKVYDDMDAATKELRAQLANVEAPFKASIKALELAEQSACDKGYALERDFATAERDEAIAQAVVTGEHSAESAWSFLVNHKVPVQQVRRSTPGYDDGFSFKKKLKNGLSVFRSNSSYGKKKYFVFDGTRLVGYWVKRNSEHPGDDTKSTAWVGKDVLYDTNDLESLENARTVAACGNGWEERQARYAIHKYHRQNGRYSRTDVTSTQFFAELEATPSVATLPTIIIEKSSQVFGNNSE